MIKNRRIPNRVWGTISPVRVVFTVTVGIGVSAITRTVIIAIGRWFHTIGENPWRVLDNGGVSLPFGIVTGQRGIQIIGIGIVLIDK